MELSNSTIWIIVLIFALCLLTFALLNKYAFDNKKSRDKYEPNVISPETAISGIESELMELINDYRELKGLNRLKFHQILSNEAVRHCLYCLDQGRPSHDNFPQRYQDVKDVLPIKRFGENIAFGYRTADAVVRGWKKSEKHNENMLGDYTHTGMAVIRDKEGKMYVVNLLMKL